jgi:hypothetical protein
MDHRSSGRARGRRAALAAGAALLFAAMIAAPVAAGGRGATVVRGVQDAYGTCSDNGEAGYLMHGSLEGCWVVESFNVDPKFDGKSNIIATGTERFVGTILGSPRGTFHTTYTYTAKFVGNYADFIEVHGRCHHAITWGEGAFEGISGELSFTDVVAVPEYPYWGSIRLDGTPTTLAVSGAPKTTATSGSSGVTC